MLGDTGLHRHDVFLKQPVLWLRLNDYHHIDQLTHNITINLRGLSFHTKAQNAGLSSIPSQSVFIFQQTIRSLIILTVL